MDLTNSTLNRTGLKGQVSALLTAIVEQARQEAAAQLKAQAAEIAQKDYKIQALTHELEYYKRIRFSPKTETLAALQRDVFEEAWGTDIVAMAADLRHLRKPQRARQWPKLTHPVRVGGRCRIICYESNTGMSLQAAPADSAAAT